MAPEVHAVFFGTPAVAVPALRALAACSTLSGVVCQPDRPAGRGLGLHEPEVKRAARELGLEVYQPHKVKTGELADWITERKVDVAVVMAYGRILPRDVLDAPRCGCVNLHASLLPNYRGAAPIQWAIMRGEKETGISLMQMDDGMDTGPVYSKHSIAIGSDDTAGELSARLAELAAQVVREDVARVVRGELRAEAQDHARATLAPPLTRDHGKIDWTRPAAEVHDQVRGLAPQPGAFTLLGGRVLRVLRTRAVGDETHADPGRVSVTPDRRIFVQTSRGTIDILLAQVEGRKVLDALSLVNGRALSSGVILGS
jgi:methionyl-tRNA formyltransferase